MREPPFSRTLEPDQQTAEDPARRHGSFVLPHLPTPIFGRADDLSGLGTLLAHEDVRLITLTGAPGIDKTRLAIEVGRSWQRLTGGDVFFVQLGAIRDPALLLPTIARGFDVQPPRHTALIDRLSACLHGRNSLLVLDNFEQILNAAGDVIDLLVRSPQLKIVITSREALRVRGEYEWNVLPLRLPRELELSEPAVLNTIPSVAMLLDRAWSGRSSATVSPEDAAALAAICVRLEGIPLAIELAAPWLRIFTPAVLLERLRSGLDLLRGGARDLPDRQRTLSNAIGWSDQLLEPHERRLIHRLSVFSDGWTIEAASVICSDPGDDVSAQMLPEHLSTLLDKNLVYRVPAGDGTVRFSMFEMIRDYAFRCLSDEGAAAIIQERHAVYYQELVLAAVPHLYQEQQALWLERLERELDNIRAALRWLIKSGAKLPALCLASRLENFWLLHDHLGEGQRWLEDCLSMRGGSYPTSEAMARRTLATLLMRRGDYQRAEQLHKLTLMYAHDSGHEELRAQSMLDLGSLHFIAGNLDAALTHFDRARGLGERIADERTTARALNQLGELDRFQDDETNAIRHYEQSLETWRRLAERERVAMVLHNLAPVVARSGDRTRAANLFKESVSISWELRNLHGLALCRAGIAGFVGSEETNARDAARLLGAAETHRAVIGVQWQPVDRAEFERSAAIVRKRLDNAIYCVSFDEGTKLTANEAFDMAMRVLSADQYRANMTRGRARPSHQRGGLSRREFDVAERVALGLTNREIAEVLHISDKTVEMHISNSFRKLGLRSRMQLATWFDQHRSSRQATQDSANVTRYAAINTGENTGTSPIS